MEETWTEQDSETFMDFGRYFVPDREEQIETICALIPECEEQINILDICCGDGTLAGALLEKFSHCSVCGFDGSPDMLKRAEANLAQYKGRYKTRIFELADRSWRTVDFSVRVVVSSLGIHHLDGEQKKQLFQDICRVLDPGGDFLIADLIQPVDKTAIEYAAKAWDDAVLERALRFDGDQKAFDAFRKMKWNFYRYPDPVDKPSSLLDQLKWLEEAGFENVDVYWMKAGHAIFGGTKEQDGW